MSKLLEVLFIGAATIGVMIGARTYGRLLTRWFPPDRPNPNKPLDLTEYRLARKRREVLERMWQRRPYDQAVDEDGP